MRHISSAKYAMFLAFWLGFTSMGWTVTLHYCNDHLAGVSILGEVDQCCSSQKMASCPVTTKNSCSNNSYSIDIDFDAYSHPVLQLDSEPLAHALPSNLVWREQIVLEDLPSICLDLPPIIPKDIPILNCSFLL